MTYNHRLMMILISVFAIFIGAIGIIAQDDTPEPFIIDAGDTLLLQGQVLDSEGNPIENAVVEIWQTDANGNYDHPNDTVPNDLVPDFQYFGTSITDADGYYVFLTIRPEQYEPRPAHIHVKVKIDDAEVLITQFYFADDFENVEDDFVFQATEDGEINFLEPVEIMDADENLVVMAMADIVLDMGDGELTLTAQQAEGPYYPVVDFSEYDNNLVSVADDDEIILPILDIMMESADDQSATEDDD